MKPRGIRPAVELAVSAALLAVNLGLALRACESLLPRLRQTLDVSHVETGEALRLAQHARGVDPAGRMPIGTLAEAAAFSRLSPGAAFAWGALLYAATALLVFALARGLGGDWAGMAAAAAWQRLYLDMPFSSGSLKQFWLTGLGLLGAIALAAHARRPRRGTASAVGAAFGLAGLTRSTYFLFPALLAAAEARRSGPWRERLARAGLLLGLFALLLAPWAFMNASVKRRFLPVESVAGDLSVVAAALGGVRGVEGDVAAFMGETQAEAGRSPLGWAIREALSEPGRYLRGLAGRLDYMLRLKPWLFALALLGLLAARSDPGAWALASQCAYLCGILSMMTVEASYLEPLWPLLLSLAAAPAGLLRRPRGAAGARVATAAVALAACLGAAVAAHASFLAIRYAVLAARRAPWSDAALDEALARRPAEDWASLAQARRLLRARDAAGAVRALEGSAGSMGDLPRHRLLLAWARAKAGDASSLLALPASPALGRDAFNDDGLVLLPVYQALAFDAAGRRGPARERMRAAFAGRLRRQGFIHAGEAADTAELRARLLRRAEASFFSELAQLLQDDDPDDADRALALAAEERPSFEAWLELARARVARGRRREAARGLEKAESSARRPEQLHALQFLWEQSGEAARARRLLERLAVLAPRRALYWSDLGVARHRGGDVAGAERAFRRALALEPGMPAATLSLAAVLAGRGESGQAARLCGEALASATQDADLRARLRACRAPALDPSLGNMGP